MFLNALQSQIRRGADGKAALTMPFPSDDIAWPLIDPKRDAGKYVVGLFEGGSAANGVKVHGVSTWTTPREIVDVLGKQSGQDVVFNAVPADVFAGFLPEHLQDELLETMLLVGDHSYYGKGEEKKQERSAKWLIKDASLPSFDQWAQENGPWKW